MKDLWCTEKLSFAQVITSLLNHLNLSLLRPWICIWENIYILKLSFTAGIRRFKFLFKEFISLVQGILMACLLHIYLVYQHYKKMENINLEKNTVLIWIFITISCLLLFVLHIHFKIVQYFRIFYCCDKKHEHKQLREERVYLLSLLHCSPSQKKSGKELKQNMNLEARIEEISTGEHCLLAFF